ncbi:amine oxidase [Stachybotrys elegans]|uniref:Amine oxidase n=1 Tax=Stachybotrys elegans TaxID=80388 RepID=A0A8K0SSJ5_9HYPO|nr:amine oxidase [Stachybotrys elegans]
MDTFRIMKDAGRQINLIRSRPWTSSDSYLAETSDTPPQDLPETPTDVDVIIIGGGFSGLMSAYRLQQAGLTTVVLEAKNAIGGRSRSQRLGNGTGIIEMGATWINNITQPKVYALTELFGLETTPQYVEGDFIFQGVDGHVRRLDGPSPSLTAGNPIDADHEAALLFLMDQASKRINIRDFDSFPAEQDVSLVEWVRMQGLWNNSHVQGSVNMLSSALVGRGPHEVGAHYLMDYIISGGGLLELNSEDERGAQYLKVKNGTTSIAVGLASAMSPGSVLINSPVSRITQCRDLAVVTTEAGQQFKGKKVILAIPTNTYADIEFVPPLPKDKATVVYNTKPGIYAKAIISYAEPWWRSAGIVGKMTSHIGPVCFTWDTSDPSASQYSLAIFVSGDIATRWHALPGPERTSSILGHLAVLVGKDLADYALSPVEVNIAEWTKEEYIGGGPTSVLGPGMLRQHGEALRRPFGNLHFGGGEMAYEWKGYLEGAVRAGERAADEVMRSLGLGELEGRDI